MCQIRRHHGRWAPSLEANYHFAVECSPEPLKKPFAEVSETRRRMLEAAQNPTGDVLPAAGYVAERLPAEDAPDPTDKRKGAQISHPNSQSERGQKNGVTRRTQQRIDRLARDFPEQHEKVNPASAILPVRVTRASP